MINSNYHNNILKFIISTLVFLLFIVNRNIAQNPTWYVSHEYNTFFDFNAIHFIDSTTGWIAGQIYDSTPPNAIKSIVLKTTDTGKNWYEQVFDSLDNSGAWVVEIDFNESGIGLLTTHNGIYASVNIGESWKHFFERTDSLFINASCIINDSTWLVGGGLDSSIITSKQYSSMAKILKTKNYGLTWETVYNDSLSLIKILNRINSNIVIAVAGSTILLSIDSGENWDIIGEFQNLIFKDIQTINQRLIALVVDNDTFSDAIYISNNFGESWQLAYTFSSDESIYCMHFADTLIGRVGGNTQNDVIYKTIDGGYTWEEEILPITKSIWSIFTFKHTAFAATSSATLLTYGKITSVDDILQRNAYPSSFKLNQNYPNPFNPVTKIEIELNKASNVEIDVFNIQGKLISSLLNENKSAGNHSIIFNGSEFPSGIYYYRMKTGSFVEVKKMILIK